MAFVSHHGTHEIVDYTQESCVTSLQSQYIDIQGGVRSECIQVFIIWFEILPAIDHRLQF